MKKLVLSTDISVTGIVWVIVTMSA
jgi:hypothetical protein